MELASPTKRPSRRPYRKIVKSVLGSFLGVLIMTSVDQFLFQSKLGNIRFFYGSFGALVVFLYVAYDAPLAARWNIVMGHLVASFVGVSVRLLCTHFLKIDDYLQMAFAVSVSIGCMCTLNCLNPPGMFFCPAFLLPFQCSVRSWWSRASSSGWWTGDPSDGLLVRRLCEYVMHCTSFFSRYHAVPLATGAVMMTGMAAMFNYGVRSSHIFAMINQDEVS